jgi:hypothetical protein
VRTETRNFSNECTQSATKKYGEWGRGGISKTKKPTYLPLSNLETGNEFYPFYNYNDLWALQSMMNPGLFYSFLIIQRVGRTPCAGGQPAAMLLPTQDNINTE